MRRSIEKVAIPRTIVTSCTTPLAHVRIRAAGLTVPSRMVTADDITSGKPDPEPYLKGAAVLGFAPRDCLVIEDAPAGVRSGKAAGARVMALQTTATSDSLIAEGADWIVKDCSSLFLEMSDQHDNLVINATLSGVQPFDT